MSHRFRPVVIERWMFWTHPRPPPGTRGPFKAENSPPASTPALRPTAKIPLPSLPLNSLAIDLLHGDRLIVFPPSFHLYAFTPTEFGRSRNQYNFPSNPQAAQLSCVKISVFLTRQGKLSHTYFSRTITRQWGQVDRIFTRPMTIAWKTVHIRSQGLKIFANFHEIAANKAACTLCVFIAFVHQPN